MPPMQHPGPARAKNPPAFLLHADIITAATGQVMYQTEGVVSSASRRLVVPDSVRRMLEQARHPDVEARRFGTLGFDRFREVAATMARVLRSRPGFLAEALEILEGSPLPELGNTGAPRTGRSVDPTLLEGIPEDEEHQGYPPPSLETNHPRRRATSASTRTRSAKQWKPGRGPRRKPRRRRTS